MESERSPELSPNKKRKTEAKRKQKKVRLLFPSNDICNIRQLKHDLKIHKEQRIRNLWRK